jgi:dodecin
MGLSLPVKLRPAFHGRGSLARAGGTMIRSHLRCADRVFSVPVINAISSEVDMAKAIEEDGVYKIVEVVGTSTISWEDAASTAVATAATTLRDLRIAEVTKMDMKVEDGKVIAYRARVSLSFKYAP